MREFNYLHPTNINEALELLQIYGSKAKIIAGGTDLVIQLHKDQSLIELEQIINIAHLQQLSYIIEDGEWIRIGANTTHTQLASSKLLKQEIPALVKAAESVGSPQIRNRGTIAGNILNASPAADTVPVLIAINAVLTFKSLTGERQVPLAEIYVKPYKINVLPEEILFEVAFKKLLPGTHSAFIKLGRREALAISRMNVAVIINQDQDGIIRDIRISPGSTTPLPQRISSAEEVLYGKKPTEELIELTGSKVAEEMIKSSGYRWSTEYKKPVIVTLTRRAICQALEGLR